MKVSQEKQLLEILETQQYASVDELSASLQVSTSTVHLQVSVTAETMS